jgi:PAS domain S-box-containing protein
MGPEAAACDELIRALRARETFLESILGSLESFVTVDADWRFTFINAAAGRLANMQPEETLGKDFWELAPLDALEQAAAPLRKAMHERASVEFDVVGPDDRSHFHCKAHPLADGGLAVYVRDVTEGMRAEQALRALEALKAAQLERDRLGRDLHDSVSQALFAANLKAEALGLMLEHDENASALVEQLQRLNRGALAEMRTMLIELREGGVDEVPVDQLLRNAVETAQSRAPIDVRLDIRGDAPLPTLLHIAIYRVTQEALNNVARHSRASNARVDLELAANEVHLVVADDGRGFEPALLDATHRGLKSMRERAAEAGAELRLVSEPGRGTQVLLDWRGGG